MKLTIQLDLGEGPVIVETNLFSIVAWERKYKRRASDLASGVGVEDLAYLAWEACKTNKVIVPAVFDEFVKKLVSLDVIGDEPKNPTTEALTDAD